jgi:hypothetical protein
LAYHSECIIKIKQKVAKCHIAEDFRVRERYFLELGIGTGPSGRTIAQRLAENSFMVPIEK